MHARGKSIPGLIAAASAGVLSQLRDGRGAFCQLLQLSQEEWPKVPMYLGQDVAMGRIRLCEELEAPTDRTKAIDSLINLTEGKPRQKIDVDMIFVVDMPPEQVRRRYEVVFPRFCSQLVVTI